MLFDPALDLLLASLLLRVIPGLVGLALTLLLVGLLDLG